jgi:hypothetical protein
LLLLGAGGGFSAWRYLANRLLVAGTTAASVTVLAQGHLPSAAINDTVAPEVDAARYRAGEGPCIDAARSGSTLEQAARRIITALDDPLGG